MSPGSDVPTPEHSLLGRANATFWGGLSRLRGARILHPDGTAYRGTLSVRPNGASFGVPLFDEPRTHTAIARFSRSAGLPAPLPDLLGMTVRIEDAHGEGHPQDFPMITSARGPVAQHLLLFAVAGFFGQPYSTALPYSVGDRTYVIVGSAHAPPGPIGTRGRFEELEQARARGALRFDLGVADLRGARTRIGTLHFTDRLPDGESEALRFNPWNSGGGIRPTGPLMGTRLSAYRGSQAGRERARR